MLVSYLKHGKASVYPLCAHETMCASQHDLLQNSAVKFFAKNIDAQLSSSRVLCVDCTLAEELTEGRKRSKDN